MKIGTNPEISIDIDAIVREPKKTLIYVKYNSLLWDYIKSQIKNQTIYFEGKMLCDSFSDNKSICLVFAYLSNVLTVKQKPNEHEKN